MYIFSGAYDENYVSKLFFSFDFLSFIDWRIMIVEQVLLGVLGVIASLYTFYVKKQHEKNPKYKAMCDLGPNASCTKVLTSK